jgi:hypothetical protein
LIGGLKCENSRELQNIILLVESSLATASIILGIIGQGNVVILASAVVSTVNQICREIRSLSGRLERLLL